jgi:hypothetical protein
MKQEKKLVQTPVVKSPLLFSRNNYIFISAGALLLVIGLLLMAGGGAELGPDGYAHEFDESIYSFRRLTLAPLVMVAGFISVAIGIMKKFN